MDPQGNLYYRVKGGDETWIAFQTLNEVEIIAHESGSGWGMVLPWENYGNGGHYGGGSSGDGGNSGGGGGEDSYLSDAFTNMLSATGTTANAFGGIMKDTASLAKLGDFSKEAEALLKSIGRNANLVGSILDGINTTIEIFEDGNLTADEAGNLIADIVIGRAFGAIPFVGGIVAGIYDVSGLDDLVREKIKELIEQHFGNITLISN